MGNFDRYSNKPNKAPFLGVTFGFNRLVLEVELNEAQQIQNERMLALMNIHGDCVINRDGFSYDGTSLTFDTKVVKDGIMIDTVGTVFAVSNGESVYIKSEVVDYTFSDTIHENGNTDGAVIENTLKDSRAKGLETTRRKGYTFTINKESGMLIGAIVDNNFVCLAPDYFSGIHRYITDYVSAPSKKGGVKVNRLYGKSEQKQYSGKNLIDFNISHDSELNGISVSAVKTNDGLLEYLAFNGTCNSDNTYFQFSNVSAGCKIILNPNKDISVDKVYIQIDKLYGSYKLDSAPSILDTTGFFRIYIKNGVTLSDLRIYPMIVAPDETDYTYEPYVGGIPSPNPDYPQEIKITANPVVRTCGKNLLNPTLNTTTDSGVTCTNNGDGTFTLNGTATANCVFGVIGPGLKKIFRTNEKLRLTGAPKGSSKTGYYLQMWKNEPEVIYYDTGGGVTVKNPNADVTVKNPNVDCNVAIMISNGTVCNNVLFKPMLTTDLTATYDDFEPYKETIATLPYTLNAIPVESGGNITIDGQQYISDYVDFEKKQLVRMVDKHVFDGSDSASLFTTSGGYQYSYTDIINQRYANIGICEGFSMSDSIVWDGLTNNKFMFHPNIDNTTIRFRFDEKTTVDEWNNWLRANPQTLFYPLATPIIIDLTDDEVQAFLELNSYSNVTNVFTSSDVVSPILDFEVSNTETGAKALDSENKCTAIAGEVGTIAREVASMTRIVVSNTEPDDKSVVWVK